MKRSSPPVAKSTFSFTPFKRCRGGDQGRRTLPSLCTSLLSVHLHSDCGEEMKTTTVSKLMTSEWAPGIKQSSTLGSSVHLCLNSSNVSLILSHELKVPFRGMGLGEGRHPSRHAETCVYVGTGACYHMWDSQWVIFMTPTPPPSRR